MRWIPALRICVAASLLSGGAAHAADDGSFRIGDWSGRPYFSEQKDKKQKEKRFDRCSAQQTNADKITMIYSLDSHYMLGIEFIGYGCLLLAFTAVQYACLLTSAPKA